MLENVLNGCLEIFLAGLVFFFVEKLKPAFQQTKDIRKEKRQEFILSIFNVVFSSYVVLFLLSFWVENILTPLMWYQVFDSLILQLPLFVQVFLGAAILDLSKYWQHRISHSYLWRFHAIHHSARELTWITGLRLHPVEIVVAAMFDATFLFVLGFGGEAIMVAILLLKVLNFVIHSNLNLKFNKPLRYILASPHYHRWHHADQVSAYDKNFAGAFPFWDILFGTYYHPEALPDGYGLSKAERDNYPESIVGWLLYPFKKFRNSDGS